MLFFKRRKFSQAIQYSLSIAIVLFAAFLCFVFSGIIGYKVVALLMLMIVSILAMFFDILPVLIAALLSALLWNFFFIPPLFTFHIDNTENLLMFLMYFLIASVNAVLTFKIRDAEKKVRDKEEKENSIRLYNTLLNSLSHEMRTPLATIIAAKDTLKENKNNLSEQNKDQLLNEIDIACIRLNRQVENLLNMNRLEAGMLQLKSDWCDINEMIFSVIEKIKVNQITQKIIFNAGNDLPLFKLDEGLMEQVIHNLIHNAVVYNPSNTEIKIETKYEAEKCIIVISDSGNGFPQDKIEKVFEKFYRLPDSKVGGSGLGLSIVKGFIEAHNGTIQLKSETGKGSEFIISIPAETSFIANLKNE